MKTIKINLYQYDELSDKAKQKAIENLHDINVDYDWWEFVYDDAENIGLKITGFDTGRNNSIEIAYGTRNDAASVIDKILKEHGEACDSHKTALEHKKHLHKNVGLEDEELYEEIQEDIERDFLQAIGEDFLILLKNQYEYLLSDESIIETIKCNEYDFTDDGKLY